MVTGRMGHISVFCSYAREDESYRERLEEHLAPLRSDKVIDDWYDSRIKPGSRWDDDIKRALDQSRLVLFIVTPDLLASRYVSQVELPRSLELERTGRCQIVPVVARAAEWGDSPLADFQALPREARPIESFPDQNAAFEEVAAGLAEVCKRIVDWENPYKRAGVGDWTLIEQTASLPTGEAVTAQGTSELVQKTETQATVSLHVVLGDQRQEQTITIDLTEPLEDRMGDMMNQLGQGLPANAEVWIGPSQYTEDILFIGGDRYETVKATRQLRIEQRGEKVEGTVSTWRCIDVPLDGIVKGTGDLGVMRQNQVLLDFGHGDAATRKPQLFPPGTGVTGGPATGDAPGVPGGQGVGGETGDFAPSPPPGPFSPGRWQIEAHMLGMVTAYDLFLHPNGVVEGMQMAMGVSAQVQGQWGFDPQSHVLTLQLVAMMMGMPAGQDLIQMQIVGEAGGILQGADAMGRQFALRRIA